MQRVKPRAGLASSQTARIDSAGELASSAGPMMGPRGVTSTSSMTGDLPRTSITSRRSSHGSNASPRRTLRPSGATSSMNRSTVSARPAVTPQAAMPLCPAPNAGQADHRGARDVPTAACAGAPGTSAAAARPPGGGRSPGWACPTRSSRRQRPGVGAATATRKRRGRLEVTRRGGRRQARLRARRRDHDVLLRVRRRVEVAQRLRAIREQDLEARQLDVPVADEQEREQLAHRHHVLGPPMARSRAQQGELGRTALAIPRRDRR